MKKILMACAISVLGFSSVSASYTRTSGLSVPDAIAKIVNECQGRTVTRVVRDTGDVAYSLICPNSASATQPTTPIISSTVAVNTIKPLVEPDLDLIPVIDDTNSNLMK